jgi:hypothetical protein
MTDTPTPRTLKFEFAEEDLEIEYDLAIAFKLSNQADSILSIPSTDTQLKMNLSILWLLPILRSWNKRDKETGNVLPISQESFDKLPFQFGIIIIREIVDDLAKIGRKRIKMLIRQSKGRFVG